MNTNTNTNTSGNHEVIGVAVNLFAHANAVEQVFENWMQNLNGYKRITTFAHDFAIADVFGREGILDTYKGAEECYRNNYKYLTELSLVLNFLCHFWHSLGSKTRSELYADLYYKSRDAFYGRFGRAEGDSDEERERKAEARAYYFEWTD